MTQYQAIKSQLNGKPYLTVDVETGTVRLLTKVEAFEMMLGDSSKRITVDAKSVLENFAALDGVGKADKEFAMKEIATIAGISYHTGYHWVKRFKALPKPVKGFGGGGTGDEQKARFDWRAAFLCGLIGSIHRNGIRNPHKLAVVNKNLGKLFTSTNKKRTAKRMTASQQS